MAAHQKHAKLAKPEQGWFGRREWAFMGTNCGQIQVWAAALARALSPLKVGYVDADHKSADVGAAEAPPFAGVYTDKINFNRFDFPGTWDQWQARASFHHCDAVLVNGNHFAADKQIVALDRRKFDSLERKVARLTQVDFFLSQPDDPNHATPEALPEAVKVQLPHWRDIPVLDPRDIPAFTQALLRHLQPPTLKALVLAGGKSTRMGADKAGLHYHDVPQWQHLSHLLANIGVEPHISCRAEQVESFTGASTIADTFLGLGPMGALLSALQSDPNAAWLVVACDLPLIDKATLEYLIAHRNPSKTATCFRQADPMATKNEADFPEPLITIWEPRSYPLLLQFLAQGVSCPRKVLLNSDIELLDAPNPLLLLNANTPEEQARAKALMVRS